MVFQWFPMVANHWSDDGMVTIHRSGLRPAFTCYRVVPRPAPLSEPVFRWLADTDTSGYSQQYNTTIVGENREPRAFLNNPQQGHNMIITVLIITRMIIMRGNWFQSLDVQLTWFIMLSHI